MAANVAHDDSVNGGASQQPEEDPYVEFLDHEPGSDEDEGSDEDLDAHKDTTKFKGLKDPDLVRRGRVIRKVARINNRYVKPGMCVLVNSSQDGVVSQPYPALISELFEEGDEKLIQVTWLYRKSDIGEAERTAQGRMAENRSQVSGIRVGGQGERQDRQLYMSDQKDTIPAESVIQPCVVYFLRNEDGEPCVKQKIWGSEVLRPRFGFVCRCFCDENCILSLEEAIEEFSGTDICNEIREAMQNTADFMRTHEPRVMLAYPEDVPPEPSRKQKLQPIHAAMKSIISTLKHVQAGRATHWQGPLKKTIKAVLETISNLTDDIEVKEMRAMKADKYDTSEPTDSKEIKEEKAKAAAAKAAKETQKRMEELMAASLLPDLENQLEFALTIASLHDDEGSQALMQILRNGNVVCLLCVWLEKLHQVALPQMPLARGRRLDLYLAILRALQRLGAGEADVNWLIATKTGRRTVMPLQGNKWIIRQKASTTTKENHAKLEQVKAAAAAVKATWAKPTPAQTSGMKRMPSQQQADGPEAPQKAKRLSGSTSAKGVALQPVAAASVAGITSRGGGNTHAPGLQKQPPAAAAAASTAGNTAAVSPAPLVAPTAQAPGVSSPPSGSVVPPEPGVSALMFQSLQAAALAQQALAAGGDAAQAVGTVPSATTTTVTGLTATAAPTTTPSAMAQPADSSGRHPCADWLGVSYKPPKKKYAVYYRPTADVDNPRGDYMGSFSRPEDVYSALDEAIRKDARTATGQNDGIAFQTMVHQLWSVIKKESPNPRGSGTPNVSMPSTQKLGDDDLSPAERERLRARVLAQLQDTDSSDDEARMPPIKKGVGPSAAMLRTPAETIHDLTDLPSDDDDDDDLNSPIAVLATGGNGLGKGKTGRAEGNAESSAGPSTGVNRVATPHRTIDIRLTHSSQPYNAKYDVEAKVVLHGRHGQLSLQDWYKGITGHTVTFKRASEKVLVTSLDEIRSLSMYLKEACEVCGKVTDERNLVICDGCSYLWHWYCHPTKLEGLPEEDHWYCHNCSQEE